MCSSVSLAVRSGLPLNFFFYVAAWPKLLSVLMIQAEACLSSKQATKCSRTRLRPERLHPLCVHGEVGGRFTLVVYAAVHEKGSRTREGNVLVRKVQERGWVHWRSTDKTCQDDSRKGLVQRRFQNAEGARRRSATGLRLQIVCLADRDQGPTQRVSAEQKRSRVAQSASHGTGALTGRTSALGKLE